ncbi:lytic transglycosylase domain-containing protein [Lelliottia sp. WAP21]|uniref:lytic transglycosylase domain-containing protein n=1 Tax=Lelliottia sp. WAP21 TaxID=2877426 RepID=UPI001E5A5A59|nr:lytic transglycosylase domain-containing protein [Lelliottia sp. WAP21]
MNLKNTRNTVIYLKPNKYKVAKNKLESSIEIKNFIQEQATHFNVDPVLIDAIITVESGYNLNALSPKGALGLMQLMPATARELAKKEGVQFEDGHLLDPKTNIRLGVKYLAELGNRYNNNVELVLAAYHAGIGNVAQYNNKVPPFESTRRYVRDVTCLYNNLHSASVMSTLCKL